VTKSSPTPNEVSDAIKASWHRFLELYEPLRPDLYRYCRHLTRNAWDAEDLVQDTMARAFVMLGTLFEPAKNPRAWLIRVATNSWIDHSRRAREELGDVPEMATSDDPRARREAAGTLMVRLSPQERAALVLKDVFDMSLDEIAVALSTTSGAVKAALHRGRGKIVVPEASTPSSAPAPAVLDAFCVAFDARNLAGLTSLLLDDAVVEIVGVAPQSSAAAVEPGTGILHNTLFAPLSGGVEARHLAGYLPTPPRAEVHDHEGERIVVYWHAHADGEAIRSVVRIETDGDRITRIREHFFTPDVIAEIGAALGLPFRTNGYRWRARG
jgi:RNA polymerase sigma-70 factor (ECF subfamily)